jgi:hypothetical protein
MKKIVAIHLKSLPLGVHYHYNEQFNVRLTAAGEVVLEAVAPQLPVYRACLAKERLSVDWEHHSELTVKIVVADKEVDRNLVGINGMVSVGRHSSLSAVKASGEKVQRLLKGFGNIQRKSYDEKASAVESLLRHFADEYAHDVDNLGMGVWVQLLGVANTTFVNLLNQRSDERVDKPPYTAEEARKETDASYHEIVYIINSHAGAGTSPDFEAFIDRLNPEIERLNAEFHRVLRDIGVLGRAMVVTIPVQIYTELPIIVVPEVYYIDDDGKATRLWLGMDFDLSFRNNIDVGMAEVTIHGKGDYTGQVTVKFNIARNPTPNNG